MVHRQTTCATTGAAGTPLLARTPENRPEVLPRFLHRSKAEAKLVSAELCPAVAAPRRDVVTALLHPGPLPRLVPGEMEAGHGGAVHPANRLLDVKSKPSGAASSAGASPLPAPAARLEVEPLDAESSRMHVTVSRRLLEKLDRARAALSHSHPGASAQEILEAGLDLLLERQAKRRGQVEKPRREAPPSRTDRVPAHVRRAVWKRDGGRCQWSVDGGGVCGSTHQVEIDHIVPKGRGGQATIENTRLLCRVHNQYAARLVYGDAWMDRFTQGRGTRPSREPPPVPPPP